MILSLMIAVSYSFLISCQSPQNEIKDLPQESKVVQANVGGNETMKDISIESATEKMQDEVSEVNAEMEKKVGEMVDNKVVEENNTKVNTTQVSEKEEIVESISQKEEKNPTSLEKKTNPQLKESRSDNGTTETTTAINDNTEQVEVESPVVKEEPTPVVEKQEKEKPVQVAWNHQLWDDVLTRHVSDEGKVNYAAIKANPKGLNAYIGDVTSMKPMASWSANEEKAFWINAYNAFTVKMIVDNYPVGSITDLHGGKPWDKRWIEIGGKTYSLNDIEHKILRPKFNDARIHFAVNCAAKSCPKIWNRAWTKENIEGALDKLTKSFVTNTAHNQISNNEVKLSKIFEWYKEDFGDLINFLNKYSSTKISSNANIAFNDYNWKLNS